MDKKRDVDDNNSNAGDFNSKLNDSVASSEKSRYQLERRITGIENMLQDKFKENESLEYHIEILNQEITYLKDALKNYSSLERKLDDITSENKRLGELISSLKSGLINVQKYVHSECCKQVEQLEKDLSAQIKEMTDTIENNYNRRHKDLKHLLADISVKESLEKRKHISINDVYGNSSQGFENVASSNDDSENETCEYTERMTGVVDVNMSSERLLFTTSSELKPKSNSVEFSKASSSMCTTSFNGLSNTLITNSGAKGNVPDSEFKSTFLFGNKPNLFGDKPFQSNMFCVPKSNLVGSHLTATERDTNSNLGKSIDTGSQQTSNNFLKSQSSLFISSKTKPEVFPFQRGLTSFGDSANSKETHNLFNRQKESEPVSLFGSNSNVPSFSSMIVDDGKGFAGVSETKWQGGSKLFINLSSKDESNSVKEDEIAEHDPEFKPIIDLPPLIEIVRDDDNKVILFKNRCKLYRFVKGEWKERGVGDMKVLRAPDGPVTMVMRREQIHKICCNQRVNRDSHKLTTMGNDKSVCWIAPDFSDGESSMEKFAVKFSDKSIMDEFTKVLADAQILL